jgi:hypothetical protein
MGNKTRRSQLVTVYLIQTRNGSVLIPPIPNQKNCGEARTSFNFLAVENLLCIQGIKLAVALNMGLCAMIV